MLEALVLLIFKNIGLQLWLVRRWFLWAAADYLLVADDDLWVLLIYKLSIARLCPDIVTSASWIKVVIPSSVARRCRRCFCLADC